MPIRPSGHVTMPPRHQQVNLDTQGGGGGVRFNPGAIEHAVDALVNYMMPGGYKKQGNWEVGRQLGIMMTWMPMGNIAEYYFETSLCIWVSPVTMGILGAKAAPLQALGSKGCALLRNRREQRCARTRHLETEAGDFSDIEPLELQRWVPPRVFTRGR